MHWTERQHAITNIGAELKRRGWETYDYDPGEVDGMTDYYRPASWGGVATHLSHPGVVVCVAVSKHGVAWNSDKNGHPAFHETPKGRAWHVERERQVVGAGVGLEACSCYGAEGAQAAAKVCDEIEAAVATGPSTPIATTEAVAGEAHYRIQHDRDWTWVFFTHKPPQAVLEAVSALGASFSGKRTGWYIKRNVPDDEIAAAIQGAIRPAQAPAADDPQDVWEAQIGKGEAHDLIPAWARPHLPKLYSAENQPDPTIYLKLFTPDSSWTWYVAEFDGQDICFGLVIGFEAELGYFSLGEMQGVTGPLRLKIERDLWFRPVPLSQVQEKACRPEDVAKAAAQPEPVRRRDADLRFAAACSAGSQPNELAGVGTGAPGEREAPWQRPRHSAGTTLNVGISIHTKKFWETGTFLF